MRCAPMLAVLISLAMGACVLRPPSYEGKACDAEHPCPAGFSCLLKQCTACTAGGCDGGAEIPEGTLLFAESFEDTALAVRGWYDDPTASLGNDAAPDAGAHSFQCLINTRATACMAGKPGRHAFTATERVYVSMQVKFSANWVASGAPSYAVTLLHLTTDKDGAFIGPTSSHLTVNLGVVNGKTSVTLSDTLNVDTQCVLLPNNTFVGCNGDANSYAFTENRSVAACNGLVGDLGTYDCFDNGGEWYSSRTWTAATAWFGDAPGPQYKGDWHRLAFYLEMNTIEAGESVADGRLRVWIDGELTMAYNRLLLRTGANATQQFNRVLVLPYVPGESPVAQSVLIDDFKVGTGLLP